jgi:hypothetical protein
VGHAGAVEGVLPVSWVLRQLCRDRKTPDFELSCTDQTLDFFPDDYIGRRIRALYRRARSAEELNKSHRIANWFCIYWHGLFEPGVQDALHNLIAPLPETETIRHINTPQELPILSATHNLSLENSSMTLSAANTRSTGLTTRTNSPSPESNAATMASGRSTTSAASGTPIRLRK